MALPFYVWFTVIVSILVQKSFGHQCNLDDLSCDSCIRCGGVWCNEFGSDHCDLAQDDDGRCPDHQETVRSITRVVRHSDLVTPSYVEETLFVGEPRFLQIQYTARTNHTPSITITNSTQSFNIIIKASETKCTGLNCVTTIEAKPSIDFCFNNGGSNEYVYVEVIVGGLSEKVVLKYHVPCACECSKKIEFNSASCSMHGDLSCGKCTCHDKWIGEDCSSPVCGDRSRGDVPCAPSKNNVQCSGNGYCGPCDTCVCYTDRVGSQYFDPDNDCEDVCTRVSYCDTCLVNETLGYCYECQTNDLYVKKYNESLLNERDSFNRTVWVSCNETVSDCYVRYVAMKNSNNDIIVMVVESCNTVITGGRGGESQVSIALAVLGVLAVVAAAGGVLYWHHMNAAAPVPLNNPGYQNIVAEGSSGQNPLYKDPWSSFKNPMYGDKS